jgi:hypothetical protein
VIDRDTGRLRFDAPRSSHNGGIVPVLALPSRIPVNSEGSFFRSCPTSTSVPEVTVTGRSVNEKGRGCSKEFMRASLPEDHDLR